MLLPTAHASIAAEPNRSSRAADAGADDDGGEASLADDSFAQKLFQLQQHSKRGW